MNSVTEMSLQHVQQELYIRYVNEGYEFSRGVKTKPEKGGYMDVLFVVKRLLRI